MSVDWTSRLLGLLGWFCCVVGGMIWRLSLDSGCVMLMDLSVWIVLLAIPKMVLVGCLETVRGPSVLIAGVVVRVLSTIWNDRPPLLGLPFRLAIAL